MLKLHVLLFLLCYESASVNSNKSEPWPRHSVTPKLRVLYGHDAETDEYPFIAVLIVIPEPDMFYRYCTASIITKNHALTSGHCITKLSDQQLYVWHGNHASSPLETGAYTAVTEYIPHPAIRFLLDFSLPLHPIINDIGLLRFNDINLPRYGSLSAADYLTMVGLPVKYVGAGLTKKSGDDNERPLQVGEGVLSSCPPEYLEVSKTIVCVVPKCSSRLTNIAPGDSGGPLLENGKIIGVNTLKLSNHNYTSMTGCTPVSPYLDWIYSIIHRLDID